MKTLIYWLVMSVSGASFVSEDFRDKVKHVVVVTANGIERLVIRGNYRELRIVDKDNFDKTIKTPGRIVIVHFHSGLSTHGRQSSIHFNEKMKDLPAKVLIVRIEKEGNEELFERLRIKKLPAVQIYREGLLRRNYNSPVDSERVLRDTKIILHE